MKRVFVALMDSEKHRVLHDLRKLGLLHVEPVQGSGRTWDELNVERATVNSAISLLAEYKKPQDSLALGLREGMDLARTVMQHAAVITEGLEESAGIQREVDRCKGWGNFEPAAVVRLADAGIPLRFAEIAVKKLGSLPADLEYLRLSDQKGLLRLAVLAGPERELPAELREFRLPAKSLAALETDLSASRARVAAARKAVEELASRRVALQGVLELTERELTFETLHSGMSVEGNISWFSAWVPAKDEQRLQEAATAKGWGLLIDEPQDEEQPPTKIENNALVRIIQPVFDFLGTVPNYREYDISLWFLLFFGLFFAMIFGDAGYGLLMFGGVVFATLKSLGAGKGVSDGLKLFLYMTGLTVIWGALTGTWFALPPEALPGFIKALALPPIAGWNPASGDNIKVFCFILGALQLSIAHIKNMIRDFPKPKFLGQVGALALVLGMYFMVLTLVVDADRYPIPSYGLYMIGFGFLAHAFFSNWETGPVQAILDTLKNIISIFLGAVSFFADIVSYIRLWAVGLAGVAISQATNGMASGLLRVSLAFLFGAMILLIGHGLNLVMGALSVVVHGVRLNLLEFSGHMNMEWSGYRYEPFKDLDEKVSVTRKGAPK
ncbi:MAG: V-type ATPase 116kDa subunit family protein [Clostridia bacterium]